VYNDEANSAHGGEGDLVLMDHPNNVRDVERVDVGLVFVSRRSGLDLRRRMDQLSLTKYETIVPWPSGLTTDHDGHDEEDIPAYYVTPRDMFPSATAYGGWSLPISVDQKSELGGSDGGWPRGSTATRDSFWGGIRYVLIALLILTPLVRGCFVWHGAGGRVQFRRNDVGRVVGLHIVQPEGTWMTGWEDGPGFEGDAERRRNRIRKMTQDEVFNLPEIEYTASADDDEDDNDEDNDDDLEGAPAEGTGKRDGSEDFADVDIASSGEPEAAATGDESVISSENSPTSYKTTCTSCSICIDDFEAGEKIRLLPRCGHAFHTDCILPWLTERSGSCPLCKRNVMGDGTDGLEEEGSGDGNDDSNSIIDDGGDDAEERLPENEDGDVEEGRAQDSRTTRESVSRSTSNGAIRTSNSARTRRARRLWSN